MRNLFATLCVLLFIGLGLVYMSKNDLSKTAEEVVTSPQVEEPKPVVEEIKAESKIFNDYKEALAESVKTNKPMFLFFTADWCAFCKKMKLETLESEQIKKDLVSDYVPCFLDFDKNKTVARQFKIRQIPTYIAISPDGVVLSRGQGFKNVEEFKLWLEPKNVSFIE